MTNALERDGVASVFADGGEMGDRWRAECTQLAEVFRRSPSFLAVLRGPDHVFELVNESYYQLVGHRELIGKPMLEAIPEAAGQGYKELLDGVLDTGEPFVGRAIPAMLIRVAGEEPRERFIDLTYMPVTEEDGVRTGVIAHGTDVTEHVLAQREVERLLVAERKASAEAEQARAEAERANRSKSDFLAAMSHELRTPLNAIGGYAELVEMGLRGPVTPEQQKDLARIQRCQRHLVQLIDGVLHYAKVGAGAVHYEREEVRLSEVLATCEMLTAPQLRATNMTLSFAVCDPRHRALADRVKVQQIVLNLISNAMKFTEAGGRVTVECTADGERRQLIRVTDTGSGMDASQLERIFEPFIQVDSHLTRTHDGTGLGLAISRELARGMDGDLTVESTPGVGSTFTLSLPAA